MRRALLLIFISSAFCASAIRTTSLGQRIRESTSSLVSAPSYHVPADNLLLPGEDAGLWYVLNGDGGTPIGSLAFATTGTVVPFADAVICPSGTGCAPISTIESLAGASNYLSTAAVTNGTGDFTIAVLVHSSETGGSKGFVEKDGFTGAETLDGYSIGKGNFGNEIRFRVRTTSGPFEVVYDRDFIVGAWYWLVGVYDSVGAGTSTLDLYVNGRPAPGRVTNAGATRITNTGPHYIFRGGWAGVAGAADTRYGGGFYTEVAITSAARQTQLYQQAMGRNQAYVTRASPKFCAGTEYGNFVDWNEPCGSAEATSTNTLEDGRSVTQSWLFGGSSDVATGLRAMDMTHTATTANFVAAVGPGQEGHRRQVFACGDGFYGACSVYLRSPDGGTTDLQIGGGPQSQDGGVIVRTDCVVGPTFSRCSVSWPGETANNSHCALGKGLFVNATQANHNVVLSLAQFECVATSPSTATSVISTGAGVGNTPKTRAAETP